MATQRNLSQSILQVIFSFFLGLAVVAFVGIAVNTLYPQPQTDPYVESVQATWSLTTSFILLALATVAMVASMLLPETLAVVANGVLLGGLFTMVFGVGISISNQTSWARLLVVTLALLVTLGMGWWKFSNRRPASTTGAADAPSADGELAVRVQTLEGKLDAIARALSSGS